MKILFDHPQPFFLAHGGLQIQIEQTKAALEQIGLNVEYIRWWEAEQTGNLIHFFSVAGAEYLRLARQRKLPVVMTPLFSSTCNRPAWRLAVQAAIIQGILAVPFFQASKKQLTWTAYSECDHLTVGLEAEKEVLVKVFHVEPSMVSVVPLGLCDAYLKAAPAARRGDYLISTGTIYPVKGTIPLAMLARGAQVPMLFVGKPYDPSDPYWPEFKSLIDDKWVKYHPHVETEAEMISLLRGARGFVLYSQFENWSLSSSEAVACGLPLLLPDKKWSRERFGDQARFFTVGHRRNVRILRDFFEDCVSLPAPKVPLLSWRDVARRLQNVYAEVLNGSR